MPVNLLGLMAIAMFYIITVVVGLCANRCLAHEDDEQPDDEGGGLDHRKMEREAQLELVKLIETFHIASLARNSAPAQPRRHNSNSSTDTDTQSLNNRRAHGSGGRPFPQRPRLVLHPPDMVETVGETVDPDHIEILQPDLNHHPKCANRLHPDSASQDELGVGSEGGEEGGSQESARTTLPPAGKYLLAERNVGLVLGSMSLLAIRTGGVFSSSIVQMIYERGLLWCQVPIAASLSLIIGGAMFGGSLYGEGYVSVIDVFQDVYGVRAGLIFLVPLLLGDILFATIILSSLGGLVETILGFPGIIGVVMSLLAMLLYLLSGGLYAGTLTDASQFVYLTLGSWILIPFALNNPFLKGGQGLGSLMGEWLGEVQGRHSGIYIDQMALLILGGIPMQSYFQRVFSSTTPKAARMMTITGSIGCLLNAIPAVLIGASIASTEWANTTYLAPPSPISQNGSLILPVGFNLIVPSSILFLVLGAIVSGLLAAGDSALFGLATIITHNVYRNWLKPHATEAELIWLARLSVAILAGICLLLCVAWSSWHSVWLLPYDILYVLVFPQLFCACYFRYANTVGAFSGLVVGLGLRLSLGEPRVGLPPLLPLLFWSPKEGQLFPYRTLAMLANLLTTIIVSGAVHVLWRAGKLAATPNDLCCLPRRSRAPRDLVARRPEPPPKWRPPMSGSMDNSFLDLRSLPARGLPALPGASPLSRSQAAKLLANEFGHVPDTIHPHSALPHSAHPLQKMTVL